MTTNTRMTYVSTLSSYHDQREVSILAGELSAPQIRRLTFSTSFNRLDELIESCGLVRLPSNGSGISLETLTPTLEAPTNARVDAQAFFKLARLTFARAAMAQQKHVDFKVIASHMAKFASKPADEQISDKRGFLGTQPNRDVVGRWLQHMLMGPMAAGAYLSDLDLPIADAAAVSKLTFSDLGNVEALMCIDAAWPTVMGGAPDPVLKRALTNSEPLTAGEAVRAFEAAQRYIAAAEKLVAGAR